jgi:hypothetical protein
MIGKTPGVDAFHWKTWPVFGSLNTAGEAHAAVRIAEMTTKILFIVTGLYAVQYNVVWPTASRS